jgi:hypothetical protein
MHIAQSTHKHIDAHHHQLAAQLCGQQVNKSAHQLRQQIT